MSRMLEREIDRLAWEISQLKALNRKLNEGPSDIEYNEQAEGCGLEDRDITDRYEAMRYGWEQAMEAVGRTMKSIEEAS